MKTALGTTTAALAVVSLAHGCSVPTNQDAPGGPGEPVSAISSPIEQGDPINETDNPISYLFPLSTVSVTTPLVGRCTGVILTLQPVTRILTAAHCATNAQSQVWLFKSGPGVARKPDLKNPVPVAGPPDLEQNLGVCSMTVPGSVPDTCYSDEGGTRHYADLAVLTLKTPLSSPYRPVILAPQQALTTTASTWAVGTGFMNLGAWAACDAGTDDLNVINPDREMWWVPASLPDEPLIEFNDGYFTTSRYHTDIGDSGGPAYQYMSKTLPMPADGYNLQLTGILSSGVCGGTGWDQYTSTQTVNNFNWLVNKEGGSVNPFLALEDAGLGDDAAIAAAPDASVTPIEDAGNQPATPLGGAANGLTVDVSVGGGGCAIGRDPRRSGVSFAALGALALLGARRRRSWR